ncbi:hypothetical protein [Salipiger bermudensis]|uniref:hypothetical protein n=1 Tax=Salipiger bermudensis TaxID=344736 RepID=UPI001A9002DB|nr:hypothetical protein [Salipiger bermudensis]MBN9675192.1 hypothetical protein [Salipiger bermudensis]
MPTRITTAIFLAIAAEFSAEPAAAQQQSRVAFEPGASSATISGTITGQEVIDYALGASAGQTLEASITVDGTNGDGTIYFNNMPPGATYEAIFLGQREDRKASVVLPASDDYTLRVYLMGNDRDAGKTVGFLLPVAIR